MIHPKLAKKYVGQSSVLWVGCALALFSFCWVRVWVVSLLDMGRFQVILEQFRDFERFAPIGFDQLFTYAGRVGMTYDEPVVLFCIVVWAIARGSDVVSGELNRGTMEMILAQPVSRKELMMTHAFVSVLGLGLLALFCWLGIWMGVQLTSVEETIATPTVKIPFVNLSLPMDLGEPEKRTIAMKDHIDCTHFAASSVNLFAFGFFVLALSTLMSSWDRYRWRTVGIVITIYVFQVVIFGLGKAAESLHWMTHLSFMDLYRPQPIAKVVMENGGWAAWSLVPRESGDLWGPFGFTLCLLLLGTMLYCLALSIFSRRDLPAPL